MSQFLVVTTQKVVDTPAVPAVAEVVEVLEDLTTVPPTQAVAPVAAVAAVAEVSHEEVTRSYIEDSAEQVARNLGDPNAPANVKYYSIKYNAQNKPMIKTVREKGRANAPVKEIVTIEDQDGNELGSATV